MELTRFMNRDKRYDWLAPAYNWGMTLLERALRAHRLALQTKARGRVLDIGIGTGATLPCYPPGCQVVGIDTSLAMLRQGVQRAQGLSLTFTPLVMNTQHLAFPDGQFDTIVSSLVLCSVADAHQTLCELRRVLRPGGKALFLEHVRPTGALGLLFDLANVPWSRLICQLTRRTESLVEWAGFVIVWRQAPLGFLRVLEAIPAAGHGFCADHGDDFSSPMAQLQLPNSHNNLPTS